MTDEQHILRKIERARSGLVPLHVDVGEHGEASKLTVTRQVLEELSDAIEELCASAELIDRQNQELLELRMRESRALGAVAAEQRRSQDLFELSPEAQILTNKRGTVERANEAAARLFRVETRFLKQKPLSLYVAHTSRIGLSGRFADIERSAGPVSWEETVQPRGGPAVPVHISAVAMRSGTGATDQILWSIKDLTSWKKAEETVRASEAGYRDLFEQGNDIVFTIDREGRLTSVNAGGAETFGLTPDELTGRRLEDLVTPESREAVRRLISEHLTTARGGTLESDVAIEHGRQDPVLVHLKTRVISDKGGAAAGIRGIARDLRTERELETRLREAHKLEAVGRLAGGVAHDFDNLLSVILGRSLSLRDQVRGAGEIEEGLEKIVDAAERATVLTRQLQAFGRQQSLQPRLISLNEMVRGFAPLVQGGRIFHRDIDLVLDLQEGLGMIYADPAQIEQVMMNLMLNARDAMPSGGRLTVETTEIAIGEQRAENLKVSPGVYVVLGITDTGAGMDGATREKVFEPFFTTKSLGAGSGLGLASAYGIVLQHGGFIDLETASGHGASFRIHFPRVEEPELRGEDASAA